MYKELIEALNSNGFTYNSDGDDEELWPEEGFYLYGEHNNEHIANFIYNYLEERIPENNFKIEIVENRDGTTFIVYFAWINEDGTLELNSILIEE